MKYSTATCAVLVAVASAQPHHQHRHQHVARNHLAARDIVTEIEWVTQYKYVTVTVDDSSTSTAPASSTPSGGNFYEAPTTPEHTSSSSPPPPPPPAAAPTPSSSSSETPAAPSPVNSPVNNPAAPPSQSSAPPSSDGDSNDGSKSGGTGQSSGDMTYYQVGLGACGDDDSGKDQTENIVAMSPLDMGEQSNGNPNCNKKIKISVNGKSVIAAVRDKCPSCAKGSIDVSEKVFKALCPSLDVGRQTVTWDWL